MEVIPECKETVDLSDLILFTSTFYADNSEGQLRAKFALQLIQNVINLKDTRLKLIISDGSPIKEKGMSLFEAKVREMIQNNPNIIIFHTENRLENGAKTSMADERKQALEKGLETFSGDKIFLWLEPEKGNLVTKDSLGEIMKTSKLTHADFIIPARQELNGTLRGTDQAKGMNTLSEFQAWTETRGNRALWQDMDTYYDSFFGPLAMNRQAAEEYLQSPYPDRRINVLTPVEGYQKGMKVESVPVDYSYDVLQQGFEEGKISVDGSKVSNEEGKKIRKFYGKKRLEQYKKIIYENKENEK